ncbi:hypothetical protein [Mycolicibacterium sphagni]|uniref:Uncharacterized protein n=1 Tax=Mycolicibacterium sphagni TaxID=1786 RepID=A0ABX2K8Q1_9MYCO|nr:hypothetical protein [Mycolicibacterium sphagni]NTY62565.1 hypothetical protein [Mycolicibacterium sphagni]
MTNWANEDAPPTGMHAAMLGDTNEQKWSKYQWAVTSAALRGAITPTQTDDVVPIVGLERVEPDLEGVALLLGSLKGFDPERAWEVAVSGDTAASMAGTHTRQEDECNATAALLTRAAAYGWWPKRRINGDYIAVRLDQWVAEGHPFTRKVPNADAMFDRWAIHPVVIDGAADDTSTHS